MSYKQVTHVIFDLDGLLIESESIYNRIYIEIASQFGKELPSDIRLKYLGRPEPVAADIIINELQLPISTENFLKIYKAKVKEHLQHPDLMPGVKELVEHLHKNNIPMAVATSSSADGVEVKTKNHEDVFGLFHHIVCASTDPEVKHGKPAPDIFLVCASRFPEKPDPTQCLVFEDSPNGIQGALSAGMQAILVPADYVTDELKKPATLVLNSLHDFRPELFGLPAR